MNKSDLTGLLIGKEPEAIIRTLAMMAFNPAIGRVLRKGAVNDFADMMVSTIRKLYGLPSRERFDSIHAEACEELISSLKTAKERTLSYGQAQKPINVFFKVYVDWAKLPGQDLATKLIPHLHVPLDSLVMKFIRREFSEEYQDRIGNLRERLISRTAERMRDHTSPRSVARMLVGNEFSLTGINKEMYLAWQEFFRTLWPGKPVLLDIIWVLERSRIRETGLP